MLYNTYIKTGRDWQWTPETRNNTYLKILERFEDTKTAAFSIHKIASTGASEGKEVGQWFGPNTVAQVLKYIFPCAFNIYAHDI